MENTLILKRGIMRHVSAKARPFLTPLLSQMIGDMDTIEDLRLKTDELSKIVSNMLNKNAQNKQWVPILSTDILELRQILRLTQNRLGRFTGSSRFSVSNWEHARTIPHQRQRECIFQIAEMSLASLERILKNYRG